jgi:hypothetical protein
MAARVMTKTPSVVAEARALGETRVERERCAIVGAVGWP